MHKPDAPLPNVRKMSHRLLPGECPGALALNHCVNQRKPRAKMPLAVAAGGGYDRRNEKHSGAGHAIGSGSRQAESASCPASRDHDRVFGVDPLAADLARACGSDRQAHRLQDTAGMGAAASRQLHRDLRQLQFRPLFPQQHDRGDRLDRDLAAAGDGDGLCLRPLTIPAARRSGCSCSRARCCRRSSWCCRCTRCSSVRRPQLNTWTGLIIAHLAINIPFLAWMLVAFFQGEIEQLEQAARIDGATRFQAFMLVAVPVAAPGLLAAGLLAFILSWNEFLFALILTGKPTNTLPVGLAGFQTSAGRRYRAAVRGHDRGDRAGHGAAAVHAPLSDQGHIAGSPQMSPATRVAQREPNREENHEKTAARAGLCAMMRDERPGRSTVHILMENVPDTRYIQDLLPEFKAADRHRCRDRGDQLYRHAFKAGSAALIARGRLRCDRRGFLLGRRVHPGGLADAAG